MHNLTLKEWSDLTGILPTNPTTEKGAVSVVVDQTHEHRRGLWTLTDYIVSTVSGPVCWLVPRAKPCDPAPATTDDYLRNFSR